MRIISLVPSWTETLIEAGHPPIGRTRFCIHPEPLVKSIPVVGGTKTADWEKIRELKPDLLILDKEENPIEFSQQGLPAWASHVTDGLSLTRGFLELGHLLQNSQLKKWAEEMKIVCETANLISPQPDNFPALIEVLKPWRGYEQFNYVIWKGPWMAVHPQTYIGFVLKKLGVDLKVWPHSKSLYPEFEMLIDQDQVYLFSSEPFPFVKKKQELKELDVKGALVDGEKFSWFGIRSLRFLQEELQISKSK